MNIAKAIPSLLVLGAVVAVVVTSPRAAISAVPVRDPEPSSAFDTRFRVPDSPAWREAAKLLQGRTVAVLVANDFDAVEAFYPIYRWQEAGARIITVGPAAVEYSGRGRYTLRTQTTAANLELSQVDLVFVPGGDAPKTLREDPDMVRLVQEADRRGLWIVAACHGPQLLARAGLLENRRITAWPELADEITAAGGEWLDVTAARHGRMLTSQDPRTMDALVFALIDAVVADPRRRT